MLTKAQNLMRVLLGEEPEWLPIECPSNPKYGQNAYEFIAYQGALPPRCGGRDFWGTEWQKAVNEELPYIINHPVLSIQEFSTFTFPNINERVLWKEAEKRIKSTHKKLFIGRQVSCLWERLYFLIGFNQALFALIDEPELVYDALGRIVNWQIEAGKQFIKIGVDAVRISDDYGAQTNLLMAPETWRQLIQPHLAALVSFYQQHGIAVALHSCGNLELIMDDLIELGFAAFNIQTNVNNLDAYRSRYGKKFCLWGGVSTQSVLSSGSPEDIRQAVMDVIKLFGRDGSLILEPDQIVNLPEDNLAVYWKTASHALSGDVFVDEKDP